VDEGVEDDKIVVLGPDGNVLDAVELKVDQVG
jgi:hypothetical protein